MGINPGNILKNHVSNYLENNSYAAKTLLFSSVALSIYSNALDYIQIDRSKDIEKKEKDYLKVFQITDGIISTAAQTAVGLAVISDKAQKFLIKNISKISPKLENTLKTKTGMGNLMKLTSLATAVILAKRVLVPLISTPMASVIKERINHVAKQDRSEENIFISRKFYKQDD